MAGCRSAARAPALLLLTPLACVELREPPEPAAVERCFGCHGASENGNSAPPPATWREDPEEEPHQSHLGTSSWHREVTCDSCHVVPEQVLADGHVDSLPPAEVTWAGLAGAGGATPTFDPETRVCSQVYCHGATLAPGGTHTAPVWTVVDGTQTECEACHGMPPAGRHPNLTDCRTCHRSVFDSGGIVCPELHIDGVVDYNLGGCL